MMFVGPGWLNKMGRWEAPYELLKKSYEDGMAYYGEPSVGEPEGADNREQVSWSGLYEMDATVSGTDRGTDSA